MNQQQLELVRAAKPETVFLKAAECLRDLTPRTLLYGWYTNGTYLHAYLGEDLRIHRLEYDGDNILAYDTEETVLVENYSVSKRLDPGSCDFEFCMLLKRHDVQSTFTTWGDSGPGPFHAPRRDELILVPKDFEPLNVACSVSELKLPKGEYGLVDKESRKQFQSWLTDRLSGNATRHYLRLTQLRTPPETTALDLVRQVVTAVPNWNFFTRSSGVEYPKFELRESIAVAIAERVQAAIDARIAAQTVETA